MSDVSIIRVIVVDDHELLRSGIRLSLLTCEEIELVGEASDGQKALLLCEQLRPDVVLMDMKLPGMDGAEAMRIIKGQNPEIKVLVLTSFYEQELVHRAMQAGASGYLIKSSSGDELVDAIRATYAGRTMLSSEAADALVQSAVAPPPLGYDLTDRQREVLALMAEGLTNSDIGERMHLSPSTVSYHVSEILSKLGVTNRAEAAVQALRHGLVPK